MKTIRKVFRISLLSVLSFIIGFIVMSAVGVQLYRLSNLSLLAKEVKADWYEINTLTNKIMYMRVDSINRLESLETKLLTAIDCLDTDFVNLQNHPYVFLLSADNKDELVHASYIWKFCREKLIQALAVLDEQILSDQEIMERIFHNSSGSLHEVVRNEWNNDRLSYEERIPYRDLLANMTVFDIIAGEFSTIINEVDREIPRIVEFWTIVFVLLIAVIFIGASVYLFISITRTVKPIQTLATTIQSIGDYDVSKTALETSVIKGESDDEIFIISQGINEMALKLHSLYQKILHVEKEKRKTQLQALQYQINPHFLNNTLGTIRMMATINKQEEIAECVFSLSKILRHTLVNTNYLVTFREELAVLKHYVNIIQMRYKNRLTVAYEIDQEIEGCFLPQQVLQPLVENAIMHGLSSELNKEHGNPILQVKAMLEEEHFVIEIRDNGVGIEQERLKSILERDLMQDFEQENALIHIGLYNIHRRVKLFFGETYGLALESEKDVFTSIKIVLPNIKEVKHAQGIVG